MLENLGKVYGKNDPIYGSDGGCGFAVVVCLQTADDNYIWNDKETGS